MAGESRAAIPKDVLAGLTLAAMSIPQALGYARIAGTPVVTGLYTLLLPLLAFAALGSSRGLVVAADSATAAILAGGLAALAAPGSPRYVALASLTALITGICLLFARLLRLGFLAEFLSQTVLVGFLTGVGIQVGIAVLGEMLGLEIANHRTIPQLREVVGGLGQVSLPTVALSAAVIAGILALHRFAPKFPGALLAVFAATAAGSLFGLHGSGIQVIGPVSPGLPPFGLAGVGWKDAEAVLPLALSCLIVVITQSAATARAYSVRHDQQLDQNRDLIGLGAANVAASFTGTFVVNGSPTQTAVIEQAGGRSQIAQLTTAAVVAAVLLWLTKPLQFLPRCVLSAVVFTIALGLIDWRGLRNIRHESPGEFWLASITAATVVLAGVEQGILLAMFLSLLRIVQHSYRPHTAVLVQNHGDWRLEEVAPGAITESGIVIYRFGAPLFYANASLFSEQALELAGPAPSRVQWLIVDAGPITHVDYSAAKSLLRLRKELARRGVKLAFAHVQSDLRADLDRHHITEAVGAEQIFETLHEALGAIRAAK